MSDGNREEPLFEVQEQRVRYARIANATFLTILLSLSVLVNIFLARKVKILSTPITPAGLLQVGTSVPPIVGQAKDGTEQTLSYDSSQLPTVLYVFSPQCGWCKKNLGNLKVLIDNSGTSYRLVGISLTDQDLKNYIIDNDLQMPVYTNLDDSVRAKYRLTGTPMTIVVSPESKVLKVWIGAYRDNIGQEISKYLKVKLPGCCSS